MPFPFSVIQSGVDSPGAPSTPDSVTPENCSSLEVLARYRKDIEDIRGWIRALDKITDQEAYNIYKEFEGERFTLDYQVGPDGRWYLPVDGKPLLVKDKVRRLYENVLLHLSCR